MKIGMLGFLIALVIVGWFSLWAMAIDWSFHHHGFYGVAPMLAWLIVSLTGFLSAMIASLWKWTAFRWQSRRHIV